MADGLLNKASIILTPTGYKAGTLYNVAPVVEPYEDFDFARASVASRVNSSGLVEMVGRTLSSELVVNGDFATDSDWNKGTGWSINAGEAILTNGGGSLSKTDGIFEVGKTYEFSIEITSISLGAFSPKTNTGQNIFSSVTLNTVGVHTSTFTVTSGVNLQIRASGTTTGSIDNVSVKEIIDTNNIPRISYDSNGDNGHILLEPTSTNLLPYSEDFSEWSKSSGGIGIKPVITADNVVSPNGVQNAEKVVFDLNGGGSGDESVYSLLTQNYTSVNGTTYSLSCYLKGESGGEQIIFDFDSQNSNVVTLTNEWVRYTFSKTVSTNGSRSIRFGSRGNNSGGTYGSDNPTVYIWGAQLEALPYATSYIPTLTGSQEVRATETATGAGSADLINSTEGVLYAEIAGLVDADAMDRIISLSDNTTTNRVEMKISNSGSIKGRFDSASSDITLSEAGVTASNFNKIALVWSSGKCGLFINGVKEQEDLTFSTFSSDVLFDLSFKSPYNDADGSRDFYGKVKALAVFNEALEDDELELLTGVTNYGSFGELASANGYTII